MKCRIWTAAVHSFYIADGRRKRTEKGKEKEKKKEEEENEKEEEEKEEEEEEEEEGRGEERKGEKVKEKVKEEESKKDCPDNHACSQFRNPVLMPPQSIVLCTIDHAH
ncbi:hypothetical protein scyTo_0006499 [Scyliorhinus torazame]|uniref:Uncharacterized protein n=1 Tax=Scyliorhinus torazame TaxID=75743 RepID=A0A401PIC1_SCYTO|nr:hypothetical protein [Scyliorhinus torazame]